MNLTPHDYIWFGILIVTVRYLTKDVNGIGSKTRKIISEQIIASKDRPDFETIVRRLLG
jgi:hypothetical protein